MRAILSAIGHLATRIESWWALVLLIMSTGGFAWLGQQWSVLADQGWPAIIFLAIMAASILTIALALAYMAFRWIRGKPATLSPSAGNNSGTVGALHGSTRFDDTGLYVGTMTVSTGKLQTEGWVEISARCFNATGHEAFIHRADGVIKVGESLGGTATTVGKLPPPHLVHNEKHERIADRSEFIVRLEQRVPKEFADRILAVDEDYSVGFDLEDLTIIICSHDSPSGRARLPVWDGISLRRIPDRIISGQIVIARVGPASVKAST